jgi:protein-L-isoaspartate(D-aspartate) O-methyltransferase
MESLGYMNNKDLINSIKNRGILKTEEIIKAFLRIDRKDFLRDESFATYYDTPLMIGKGQTNSQPSTVAFMLELLQPQEGDKVLDIGSGSGWTTALLCHLVKREGKVIGIERHRLLKELGEKNLKKYFDSPRRCKIIMARRELGFEGEEFDKILVSASAPKIPKPLIKQLKDGGTMVIPINESIVKVTKNKDEIKTEEYPGYVFVPLIEN